MLLKRSGFVLAVVTTTYAAVLSAPAQADDTIKIGVLAEMSGPFAPYGKQITTGMKAYMKLHGEKVGGKKIELIIKDTTGPAPEVAKRLAQELVMRDKVQFLAGFGLTPNALAVAPVATEAKVPMVIMNAATSVIPTKSPYIVRVSFTLPQVTAPMAEWAAKNKIKRVYTLVTDYAPGLDAEATFKKVFIAAGGEIVGSVRVPLRNPELAPFVQRIKDARPEAVFIFTPAGEAAVAFMKAFNDRGLAQAGIKLIGTGDVTEDEVIEAMGDAALGTITTHHYSAAHKSPQNDAFKKAFAAVAGQTRPNFMAVGGWDGMHVIYAMVRAQAQAEGGKIDGKIGGKIGGKIDGDKAIEAVKGMTIQSPRGPITIDPATRDVVQDVYVRRVEKVGNEHFNVELDKFARVKDPGKP